jgi:hypothetical protein
LRSLRPLANDRRMWVAGALVAAMVVGRAGCEPAPSPDPQPEPQPKPAPTDRLIDAPGLNVLVVYESAGRGEYTRAQRLALDGTAWRAAVKSAGGDWLCVDHDQQAAAAKFAAKWGTCDWPAEDSLPWAVVSGDGGSWQGQLTDEAALIETVEACK